MAWLVPLMIVAAATSAPMQQDSADTVFECDFEQPHDINYDTWPDHWTRRKGRGYPHYLKITIQNDQQQPRPDSPNALRIELDGGAAVIYSPPIPISPMFSYVLETELRTSGLKHDVAYVSLSFLNEKQEVLESHESDIHRQIVHWQKIRLGPVTASNPDSRFAVVALHLTPHGDESDLTGSAWFDDIWLGRLPRMTVTTNQEGNLFVDKREVVVSCQVSGISRAEPTLTMELLDVRGQLLAEETIPLLADPLTDPQISGDNAAVFSGTAEWRPSIPEKGFYQIRVSMKGPSNRTLQRTISLVMLENQATRKQGEFGWSLPGGENPLSVNALVDLLAHTGVNWAKFPAWHADDDVQQADKLAWFAERLSAENIEMIGILDQPPSVGQLLGSKERVSVATVFMEPELWHPLVDPVMVRLSLKVRWWQLGGDDDASFIFPQVYQKVQEIKEHLDQFGQKTNIGFNWNWMYATPDAGEPPWAFLSLTEPTPFTPDELQTYLRADKSSASQRWVVMDPLSSKEYDLDTRARDLVGRMVAAKIEGANGIFIRNPFDADQGLMRPDGTPGELLLPWRTTAHMISDAEYLGQIILPEGSQNHIFVRDGEAIMIVWNDRPVTETIYLGEAVKQHDLWGRTTDPDVVSQDGVKRQQIKVTAQPTFLTGVNLPVAKWRMQFQFEQQQLASVFGREQIAVYRFTNTFEQGVGGSVLVVTPNVWESTSQRSSFKLATGDEQQNAFKVVLLADASSGPQPVRIDFDITADRRYQFSVYRTMQVGLGDVVVELSTRLDDEGFLVVEENLINKTDQFVSFNCLLFAPNRRRERQQVINLGRGRTTVTFRLPDGEELIGKTLWLRAEEIGGARLLNYHVTAER